ncbi:hypothetical protein [Microbacterium laevaniformans]|uniref:hypothetical protein n=1 Tax=Microbacterium laevaniformans TaxID=36807 RepID=UPI003D95801C
MTDLNRLRASLDAAELLNLGGVAEELGISLDAARKLRQRLRKRGTELPAPVLSVPAAGDYWAREQLPALRELLADRPIGRPPRRTADDDPDT